MKTQWTLCVASMMMAATLPSSASAQQTTEQQTRAAKEERLARERREAKRIPEDRVEREVWKQFHSRPKAWLKGIELEASQRREIDAIQERTLDQLRGIHRDEESREAKGKPVGIFLDRIVDLMRTMHNEMRSVLGEKQKERFDRNVSHMKNPW